MPRRHIGHRLAGTKKINERIHAKRRALERYGLSLTTGDLREIQQQIQTQENALFVRRRSRRVSLWEVIYKNTPMYVVYDKLRDSVVTVLLPDMI